MPVTQSELRNIITADPSNYLSASQKVQADLNTLLAKSQAATAAIASSFAGIGAPLGAASSSFTNFGNTVTQSFNQAGASSQAAASVMSNAMNGAAAAAAVVPPSLGAISAEAQKMGAAVASNGNGASSALSSIATSSNGAQQAMSGVSAVAGDMAGRIADNQRAIGAYSTEIVNARSQMAELSQRIVDSTQRFGANAEVTRALKTEYATLSASTRGLVADKSQLVLETKTLQGALGSTGAATTAAGQAASKSVGFWDGLKTSLGQTTNQITSQGTAWAGYDRVATSVFAGLLGPLGGLTVGMGLLITIGGTLISKLGDLLGEKKRHIEVDKEMAATAALVNDRLAASIATGATFGDTFSRSAAGIGNLTGALNQIADSQKKVDTATKALTRSYTDLSTTGVSTTLVIDRAGLAQQVAVKSSNDLRNAIIESNNAINLHSKEMQGSIEAIALLQNATGATSAEVLNFAVKNRILAAEDLPAVSSALESNTNVLQQFVAHLANATNRTIDMAQATLSLQMALVNVKAPAFDITGTTQGMANAFATAKAGMLTAGQQLGSFGDQVAANKRNLEAANANLKEYAKIHAEGATATARNASAQRIYKEELAKANKGLMDGSAQVVQGIQRLNDASKITVDVVNKVGGAMGGASGRVKALSADLKEQEQFLRQVRDAMKGVIQAIEDGLLGGDKIGRILAATIAPVIDTLKKKAAELATTVRAAGDAITGSLGLAMDTVTPKIIRGDGSLEALINRMIDMKRAGEIAARAIEASQENLRGLLDQYDRAKQRIPESWGHIVDAIVTGSGKAGVAAAEFGLKIADALGDVSQVIGALPGRIGDSLRKTVSEFERWYQSIDGIIKLIQRILGESPDGLSGVLSKIGGIFKKTTQEAQSASQDWAGALEKMSSGVSSEMSKAASGAESGAGRIVGAFTQIASAALAFIGARGQGIAGGAISGALGGISAAGGIATALGVSLSPLTFGLSALGGALIGGILGAFGKGKSQAQKDAEARAAEQAKLSLQQTAQNVINAAIQGFDSALKFFENLDEFTAPRRAKFREFFKAMTRLMDNFVALAKTWGTTSLAQAEAVAKSIGPIAEAISSLPSVFDAINGHFGVAQSAIDQFFNDFDRVITGFFTRVEAWAVGRAKHARKIATNIAPAIDLLGPLLEAIKNMSSLSRPPDEAFGIIENVLETIVMRTAALSEKFDKAVLKVMANFAEKSGGALSLFSTGVGSLKDMVELKMPSDQDFNNVFLGIEKVITGMADIASRLATDGLGRAEAMAQASLTLFASIKAGVEALSALKDFAGVLPEIFDRFFSDFNHAIDLVAAMATRGLVFEQTSKTFKDYIASGAASLAQAFTMLAQILTAAGSFFPGGSPATATAASTVTSAAATAPLSRTFAPTSAGSSFGGGSRAAASAPVINVTVNVHGSIIEEENLGNTIVRILSDQGWRGRLARI